MFKRLVMYLILCGTLLLPSLTTATPLDELTALADSFPADTTWFMVTRTDDEYIDTLDSIAAILDEALKSFGSPLVSPVSYRYQDERATLFSDLLDDMAQELFDGSFDSTIRPWLGSTAALGITDFDDLAVFVEATDYDELNDPSIPFPIIFALDIISPDAIIHTLDDVVNDPLSDVSLSRIDVAPYTLYRNNDADVSILLHPDKLLLGKTETVLDTIDRPGSTLAENPDFLASINTLPENAYNFIVYADYPALIDGLLTVTAADPTSALTESERFMMDAIGETVNNFSIGGTILDGRTFILDIVRHINLDSTSALGLQTAVSMRIDPDFARRLDASTAFIIFQDNLSGTYTVALENLRAAAQLQQQMDDVPPDLLLNEDDIDAFEFLMEFGLRTATGLSLENDVLSWMDRNYAIAMSIHPAVADVRRFDSLRVSPLEFALIFDATSDPEGAAKTVAGIETLMTDLLDEFEEDLDFAGLRVEWDYETLVDTQALVYRMTDLNGIVIFPVEVIIAANSEIFAIGTRDMVQTALAGDGDLPQSQAFQEAGDRYFIENTSSLLLINNEALANLADLYRISDTTNPYVDQTAQTIRQIIALMSSMTISSASIDESTVITRTTLSLNLPESPE